MRGRASLICLLLQQRGNGFGRRRHQLHRFLHLFQQRQQGIDGKLQLGDRLVQQGIEGLDQRNRLIHQAGRLRASGACRLARTGNRCFHPGHHGLDADEQSTCEHQGRRLHHVPGADLNRVGAQEIGLIEFVACCVQGTVGLGNKTRNLAFHIHQQGDCLRDHGPYRHKIFGQCAQDDLGVLRVDVQFVQQLNHFVHLFLDHRDHVPQGFADGIDAGVQSIERLTHLGEHAIDGCGSGRQLVEHRIDLDPGTGQRLQQDVAQAVELCAAVDEQGVAGMDLVVERAIDAVDQVDLGLQRRQQCIALLADQLGQAGHRLRHFVRRRLHHRVQITDIAVERVTQGLHLGHGVRLQLFRPGQQGLHHGAACARPGLQRTQLLKFTGQGQQLASVLLDHGAAAPGQLGQRQCASRQAVKKWHSGAKVRHQAGQVGQQRTHGLDRFAGGIDHLLRSGTLRHQALRNGCGVAGQLAQVGGGGFQHAGAAAQDRLRIEQIRNRTHLLGDRLHAGLQGLRAGRHFACEALSLFEHRVASRLYGIGDAHWALRQYPEGMVDDFHLQRPESIAGPGARCAERILDCRHFCWRWLQR